MKHPTLTALLLSPLTAAAPLATAALAYSAFARPQAALPLLLGAALYCPLHFYPSRNRFFYVLAHELSHALAALASGVRIRKITVGKRGGFVALNSTSTLISLAPYFIPFYALAAGLAYGLAAFFMDMSPYRPLFTGAVGFLLAFHLLNTVDILAGPVQSDLKKAGGVFFSVSLVLLLNSLCLALALKLIFPELVSLRSYSAGVLDRTGLITARLFAAVSYLFNTARIYLLS
ncbi:MAG: hypothetical protein WCW52_11185 [Elusimicrobiales bacterium]|jgi:hypothetical protein